MLDSNAVVKQFLELAALPGQSRNERQVIDYLKHFLHRLGFDYYEDMAFRAIAGNAGNLICKIESPSPGARTILLAAHVDTVAVTCDRPIVKNGRIVSSNDHILGADDRVGVTVLLQILEQIAKKTISYSNIDMVFLVAEEIGLLGSKNLDYSRISAAQGFNFDCSAPVGHVVVQAPTAVDFAIRFIGSEAHSAVAPEKGINAISMASAAISRISLPQKNGDTIFNIGRITGGTGNNIIPGEVVANGEIRSFDPTKIERYLSRILEVTRTVAEEFGGRHEIDHSLRYHAFKLAETSAVFRIAKAAIEGGKRAFAPVDYLAGSDANIFNQKNIVTLNMGLGYVNNHSPDEYIEVSDLIKDVEIGLRIVEQAAALQN